MSIILCQRLNGWHYCPNQTNDATREGHFDQKVRYNFFETWKECLEWKNRFFYDTLMPICLFSKIYLHVMTVFYLTPNFLLNVTFSRWFTTMTLITFKGCSSSGHCFLRCHTWKFLADFFYNQAMTCVDFPIKKFPIKIRPWHLLTDPLGGLKNAIDSFGNYILRAFSECIKSRIKRPVCQARWQIVKRRRVPLVLLNGIFFFLLCSWHFWKEQLSVRKCQIFSPIFLQ